MPIEEILENNDYHRIISSCTLFNGFSDGELIDALNFFDAMPKTFKKGDYVQTLLSPFQRFGLVLSGNIQVCSNDIDGDPMIMANVSTGDTFGESLCFLKAESSVYIRSVTDSVIISMTADNVLSCNRSNELCKKMTLKFIEVFAKRALRMNDRIQVLSKITLREKILTLLNQYRMRLSCDEFYLPFDRKDMAIYLGTDRCALSRELSKLKKEKIIDYNKNYFIVNK